MSDAIDYDALAAALLRAGLSSTGAVSCSTNPFNSAGLRQESKLSNQAGLPKQSANKPGLPTQSKPKGRVELQTQRDMTDDNDAVSQGTHASVERWSDAVEAEMESGGVSEDSVEDRSVSGESVTFSGTKPKVSAAAATIVFGGVVDISAGGSAKERSKGYFAKVVRNKRAVSLKLLLEKYMGAKLPKPAHEHLALCTYAAGCMPDEVVNGKQRLRSLASVGDAALTLHLAVSHWAVGDSVEVAQRERTKLTCNTYLCKLMVAHKITEYIVYPPGVDSNTTVATATAFEAILGVVTLYMPVEQVRRFLQSFGYQL